MSDTLETDAAIAGTYFEAQYQSNTNDQINRVIEVSKKLERDRDAARTILETVKAYPYLPKAIWDKIVEMEKAQ